MTIFSRVKYWYNGERKVTTHEQSPDSMLMAFTTSHIEYHWSARIARAIAGFYRAHWQWLWTTAIAACSAIAIFK